MHKMLVDEKKWISESRFLHALNYCMLLPGPEAQQLAVYIGWLMHRWIGGLMAGILFILPGFFSILALSIVYGLYNEVSFVNAIFFGLKPAVISIVIAAVLRIGSKTLKTKSLVVIAALSFVALFFFKVPFPVVILSAALFGYLAGKYSPQEFDIPNPHHVTDENGDRHEDVLSQFEHKDRPSFIRSLTVLLIFGGLWWLPVILAFVFLGPEHIFTKEGLFFSKTAVVTFGGAYAVLAYVGQQAVENYGWLKPGEMLDGLGMAETTPGPLIQVVQFVGFMGAFRAAEAGTLGLSPLSAGIIGSVMTAWVTFVPCFLWIFLGAPYIEKLRNNKNLSRALTSITAAVTGVVLNLAIWFSLHVIFKTINEQQYGIVRLLLPDMSSLDWKSSILAIIAAFLTFRYKVSMIKVIGILVLIGIPVYFI